MEWHMYVSLKISLVNTVYKLLIHAMTFMCQFETESSKDYINVATWSTGWHMHVCMQSSLTEPNKPISDFKIVIVTVTMLTRPNKQQIHASSMLPLEWVYNAATWMRLKCPRHCRPCASITMENRCLTMKRASIASQRYSLQQSASRSVLNGDVSRLRSTLALFQAFLKTTNATYRQTDGLCNRNTSSHCVWSVINQQIMIQ